MNGGTGLPVRWSWLERGWVPVFLVFLAIVVYRLFATPRPAIVLAVASVGLAVFVVLYLRVMLAAVRLPGAGRRPGQLVVLCGVSVALVLVLRQDWLPAVSYYVTGVLVMSLPARRVVAAVAVLVAAELAFARLLHIGVDETVFAVASAVLFAVGMAMVRLWLVTIEQLRHARAELARLAVVDERLRFARDLHDLLGHGLSAMAVKSELAGRLLDRDPGRARREIGDVERLARVALGDIREVVAGYRSPSLGEELDGAREILAAAGIACTVSVPDRPLPQPLDEPLAWTIREAVTNVIRHARASRCRIQLTTTAGTALLEVVDDGVGPARHPAPTGSGLAGLAERLAAAGGTVDTGPAERRGFRLRARLPMGPPP